MQQIQLDDRLYQEVQRRATASGFETVDEYVADVLQQDVEEELEDVSQLFTPERLAVIDRAVAQCDAGQVLTEDEVREHFKKKYPGHEF